MGVLDSLINTIKLGENQDGYDEEDEYLDEPDEVVESPKVKAIKTEGTVDETKKAPIAKPSIARKSKTLGDGMEVCVIKPTSMEETREITDTLRANRTVVLNMEGVDVNLAQRIIDYASGTCYAIQGNLQKISNYIFIITPRSVEISGDFSELMGGAINIP